MKLKNRDGSYMVRGRTMSGSRFGGTVLVRGSSGVKLPHLRGLRGHVWLIVLK